MRQLKTLAEKSAKLAISELKEHLELRGVLDGFEDGQLEAQLSEAFSDLFVNEMGRSFVMPVVPG